MHITRTRIEMSSRDIIGIINEYVKIPNLEISEVTIGDSIAIEGSYKLGGRITFSIIVSLVSYDHNFIILRLDKFKVWKLGVFNWIKRFAMSKLLKELNSYGITSENEIVILNINKILDKLPFHLKLNIEEIDLGSDKVIVTIEDVDFLMKKLESIPKLEEKIEVEKVTDNIEQFSMNKVEDSYTKIRGSIYNKVSEKYQYFMKCAFILPDILVLLHRLLKDRRVSVKIKITIGAVIAYLALPVDILPDFVPFIGKVDDLALIFYVLNIIIDDIPLNIIIENWQGDFDELKKVKDSIKFVNRAAGGANVDKLFKFASRVYQFSKENNNFKNTKKEK